MASAHDPLTSGLTPATPPIHIAEIGMGDVGVIRQMNEAIFGEARVINTFERADLMMLVAYVGNVPAGFKVGYRENRYTFYSAKGGILPAFRRRGIARLLLYDMMTRARRNGYIRFAYDTFPNKHSGMTILGLNEGFRVMKADYNAVYRDYRLRFEIKL